VRSGAADEETRAQAGVLADAKRAPEQPRPTAEQKTAARRQSDEEEARRQAEKDAKSRAAEEQRRRAKEAEAKRQAEEEARERVAQEERRKAEGEARSRWAAEEDSGAPSGPDVFLSYAREDDARARELATALEERGFSVFRDRDIPPGQTWRSYIDEALANARCIVVAWSRHSIISDWVIEEAAEAMRRRIMVPVLFQAVQPPFGFRGIQAASLTNWRAGQPSPAFEELVRAVRRIVAEQSGSRNRR
jgi:hypothetical protein